MKTEAAVLVDLGGPLEIAELTIPSLKPGQLIVEILMSGVCHTQVLESRGYRGDDRFLPHCLGHEAAGVVREIGPGVSKTRQGESVILSWIKGSGMDVPHTQYSWGSRTVNAGAITTFSRLAVVSENRVTPMPPGVAVDAAAVLGCALATGLGAVRNVAKAQPGQSVAVFGVGRIGLAAVMGAVVAGCHPVIAVDLNPEKLVVATRLGATHVFGPDGVLEQIQQLCRGGVDVAIEASGRPELMTTALRSVRPLGGTAIIAGNSRHGEMMQVDPKDLIVGKRLLGTWGGDTVPDRDFGLYCELLRAGTVNLDAIPATYYPLDQANQALFDLESGAVVRPMITFAERGAAV
jgi:S-(hydroxymethyl)glutathione dehydrogenase/alcohol dehydrogenase